MAIKPPESIAQMVTDSKDNFENSRFVNAARTFKHISQICLKEGYDEDAIYFRYMNIVSNKRAADAEKRSQSIRELGIICLKLSSNIASKKIEETNDLRKRAALINTAPENLENLLQEDQRKPILMALLQLYEELAEDPKIRENERESYLSKAINLAENLVDVDEDKLRI